MKNELSGYQRELAKGGMKKYYTKQIKDVQGRIAAYRKGPGDCYRCKCPTYNAKDPSTWLCDLMKGSKPTEVCGTSFSKAAGAQNAVKFDSMGMRFMKSYVQLKKGETYDTYKNLFGRFDRRIRAKIFRKTFADCGGANSKDRTWSLRTGHDTSVISCHTKTFTLNTLTHTKKVTAKILKHTLCSLIPGSAKKACSEKKVVHSCTMCNSAPDRTTGNYKGVEGILKFLLHSKKILGKGQDNGNCIAGANGKVEKCTADVVMVAAM